MSLHRAWLNSATAPDPDFSLDVCKHCDCDNVCCEHYDEHYDEEYYVMKGW